MGKYVLIYTGGEGASEMPEPGSDAFNEVMAAWGSWFESLGAAVLDGGNPIAEACCIGPDGSQSSTSASGANGYSIIEADSMEKAVVHAGGCPVLQSGGSVDVLQTIDM